MIFVHRTYAAVAAKISAMEASVASPNINEKNAVNAAIIPRCLDVLFMM
jgi:hypothetical protein